MTEKNTSGSEIKLSRREREIVDILYAKEEASAQQVQESMSDAPSYSTVRALLARLLDKGAVDKRQDGARYIYFPRQDKRAVSQNALQRVVKTFFEGSAAKAVNALLGGGEKKLSNAEIEELEALIAEAKRNNR
ncbi:BlaI/MecI/CopY family transcriptional regulator [Pseudomaricurvus alkylphenolicus]|uniref:BlaI/MecI/CopY family transcriptional regulator n=1 Tax=Pseudomaricurvus alkylphenolicus TaxID=1306991 RepID=UPI00141FF8D8|nr:BlaI/MecI/CopY family transcriptional regulator [Pseudomaricurvus alkylphenolicus]NIB39627.1 BlaI/MecI/CopY family transcriptional regulator [Pseudomaricurvus alkylphenolicus]